MQWLLLWTAYDEVVGSSLALMSDDPRVTNEGRGGVRTEGWCEGWGEGEG